MEGKIALEEHFAIPETISAAHDARYTGWFPAWPDMRLRLLDLHDLRLPEMDKYGIELMIMSLHNPTVQGIQEDSKAVALARKSNAPLTAGVAKRPDRFARLATLSMRDAEAPVV